MNWTQEMDDYLRANVGKLMFKEIADVIGRSKNSIVGRAHRLGLSAGRAKCTREERCQKEVERVRRYRATQRETRVRPSPEPVEINQNKTCCWPIGEPGTKAYRTCENHPVVGKPYCPEHCRIAYPKWQKETAPVS